MKVRISTIYEVAKFPSLGFHTHTHPKINEGADVIAPLQKRRTYLYFLIKVWRVEMTLPAFLSNCSCDYNPCSKSVFFLLLKIGTVKIPHLLPMLCIQALQSCREEK